MRNAIFAAAAPKDRLEASGPAGRHPHHGRNRCVCGWTPVLNVSRLRTITEPDRSAMLLPAKRPSMHMDAMVLDERIRPLGLAQHQIVSRTGISFI